MKTTSKTTTSNAVSSGSPKKTVFLKLVNSKAGKLYAEAITDFQVKKGERFMVLDPRKFLSEEEVSALEENGQIALTTRSGKTYTLYSSLFAEIARSNEQ